MKRNILNKYFFLGAVLISLVGCQSKKILSSSPAQPGSIEIPLNKINLDDLSKKQVVFSTFSAKAKVNLTLDKNDYDITLNLRMKKNEIIWASVTAVAGI